MLEIRRRDDVDLDVTFVDVDNNALNLTGSTVYFTVKQRKADTDDDALISKNVTSHTTPLEGKTTISLTDEDTDIAPRSYFYDLQVKTAEGKIKSIEYGLLRVQQDITIRTN